MTGATDAVLTVLLVAWHLPLWVMLAAAERLRGRPA